MSNVFYLVIYKITFITHHLLLHVAIPLDKAIIFSCDASLSPKCHVIVVILLQMLWIREFGLFRFRIHF
jgi:hypothetical protein